MFHTLLIKHPPLDGKDEKEEDEEDDKLSVTSEGKSLSNSDTKLLNDQKIQKALCKITLLLPRIDEFFFFLLTNRSSPTFWTSKKF